MRDEEGREGRGYRTGRCVFSFIALLACPPAERSCKHSMDVCVREVTCACGSGVGWCIC